MSMVSYYTRIIHVGYVGTCRDFKAAEEIVSLCNTSIVPDHADIVALQLVEDVDGGHAGVEILSIIVELKVINSHHVVVLTVGQCALECDSLRPVCSSISIVPEE